MEEKLVSIIMPCYNAERFITQAIDSVQSQIYQNWELIIVDDYSKDNSKKIIEQKLEDDSRIRGIFLKENKGAANARNIAVEKAKGEFIAFLDSDDLWTEEKLEKQIDFMTMNNYSFTSTSYNKISEKGEDLNNIIVAKKSIDYWGLLKESPGNSTVIYNAKHLGKFQIPLIMKRNDYVMWLKVIKKSNFLYGYNQVLSSHRVVSNSLSSKKTDLVKYHWYVYRDIENLSLSKSIYLTFYWIFKTVLKLGKIYIPRFKD